MADVNLNLKHLDQLKNVDMAKVRESADANGDGKASADEMAVSLFNTSFAEEGQTITDIDELGEEYAYFAEMFGGVQGDDADVSAEEINTLVGQINSSALKENDKIKYNDDGSAYVEVEPWSNDSSQNNCLERIVANNYDLEALGITPNSPEYNQLLEQVMDANPDIYGTKDGGWRTEVGGTGRVNAVIHDGEKINLPGLEKMKEVEVPPETTPDEQPPVGGETGDRSLIGDAIDIVTTPLQAVSGLNHEIASGKRDAKIVYNQGIDSAKDKAYETWDTSWEQVFDGDIMGAINTAYNGYSASFNAHIDGISQGFEEYKQGWRDGVDRAKEEFEDCLDTAEEIPVVGSVVKFFRNL